MAMGDYAHHFFPGNVTPVCRVAATKVSFHARLRAPNFGRALGPSTDGWKQGGPAEPAV